MSYILITNSDGVSFSLVHSDDEETYLAHHGVKGQRWGVRRFQNPDGSITEKGKRRMKTLHGKSDKLDVKKAKPNSPRKVNSKLANRSKDRGELIRRMQQELQRIQMQMQQEQQQELQQLINNYNATPMFF